VIRPTADRPELATRSKLRCAAHARSLAALADLGDFAIERTSSVDRDGEGVAVLADEGPQVRSDLVRAVEAGCTRSSILLLFSHRRAGGEGRAEREVDRRLERDPVAVVLTTSMRRE